METKRKAGQLTKEGRYLVLTESSRGSRESRFGYTHSCGTTILDKPVEDERLARTRNGKIIPISVPYCPKCEEEPMVECITPELLSRILK